MYGLNWLATPFHHSKQNSDYSDYSDTCTHAHMDTWTHVHMDTWTHAHMHTCTHAHMHTHYIPPNESMPLAVHS